MEILLVSPFKPIMILIAKAVPYLILSLINFTVILLLSVYMLDVPIRGNLLLLYAESTLFIIICLSLGLLISTVTASQQTAMLIAMMAMMLPTAFFTGFMFPIENMPLFFRLSPKHSLKLLLRYREESNAQRVGFYLRMERNTDSHRNGSGILNPCNEEV
ncbi:Inner membrane transport permease ybhS [Capnocytophaga ochracea]|uniref:Inner membrane transport permease ybhS n=1 Tax=Capnocytophaga ochracea TaxID=1018 RepID=A0A2X2SPZ4_CAPOC|nr:Inner membrane transport permease ybhS [Capnocytophaga ochracea]